MHLNTLDEMLKGLTNIPILLISALCGVILLRKKAAHRSKLFFMISFAALLGTVLHTFVIDKIPFVILWSLLYALLYEVARTFSNMILSVEKGIFLRESKAVFAIEGVMFIASVVLCSIDNYLDIYVFAAFAIALMINLICRIVRSHDFAGKMIPLCIMLVAVLTVQALKDTIPHGVVIVHILIALTLFVLCSFALKNRFENNT